MDKANNAVSNIMMNMYMNGSITNDTNKQLMNTMDTLEKDYYISAYRELLNSRWIVDKTTGYNYKCHIIFKNNLNIEILHLILSESQIYDMLLNFNIYYQEFWRWSHYSYNMPLGSGYHSTSSIENEYSLMLEFNSEEYMKTLEDIECGKIDESFDPVETFNLLVQEFSPSNQILYNKLKIKFNEEYLIKFHDILFFTFLIDIIDLPEYKDYYDGLYDYL